MVKGIKESFLTGVWTNRVGRGRKTPPTQLVQTPESEPFVAFGPFAVAASGPFAAFEACVGVGFEVDVDSFFSPGFELFSQYHNQGTISSNPSDSTFTLRCNFFSY